MNDRDCDNCAHHSEGGCSVWECSFAQKDDTISRQAAIDALKNRWKKTRNYEGIGDDIAEECELYLKQLPAAQPEIIHCRDCKHKGTKNCVANAWTTIFGVMVKDDFYCGLAERRTDE